MTDQRPESDAPPRDEPPASDAPKPRTDRTASEAPKPRAFAQGTGLMLQAVGVVMFLTTCCVCSTSTLWEGDIPSRGQLKQMEEHDSVVITAERMFADPARAGASLMVVFSTVGGLAMAALGLGLQSDKPKAACGAVIATGLLTLILLGAGVCLWIGGAGFFAKLWNVLITLLVGTLFGFTIAALRQVLANPPPPDLDVLPDDFEIPRGFGH